jgi:putative tryptophan/tyrosine transport system substrate-binding protein
LHPTSPERYLVDAFRQGLSETGYVEGQNVTIEHRWAQGENDRLLELAVDLVRRGVAIIAAPGSTVAALAAKAATQTIPVVFALGSDPVAIGLVAALHRPGGNVTGIAYMQGALGAKRLGLLGELVPRAACFAVLVHGNNPAGTEAFLGTIRPLTSAIKPQIEVLSATTGGEIDSAFGALLEKQADALLINPDPLFLTRRVQLVTLTARHAVPTIFPNREYADIGGLMSYGPSLNEQFRQTGIYIGRILKGEKPADMPVLRPTKFEFVINTQTAKILKIAIPSTLLALADEVIE